MLMYKFIIAKLSSAFCFANVSAHSRNSPLPYECFFFVVCSLALSSILFLFFMTLQLIPGPRAAVMSDKGVCWHW